MVCSLLPSWPQGSSVLREVRMWLLRGGGRKGRYCHAPPLFSGWTEHPSQGGIQLLAMSRHPVKSMSGRALLMGITLLQGQSNCQALFICCGNGGWWLCSYTLSHTPFFAVSLLVGARRRLIAMNQIVFELCSFCL